MTKLEFDRIVRSLQEKIDEEESTFASYSVFFDYLDKLLRDKKITKEVREIIKGIMEIVDRIRSDEIMHVKLLKNFYRKELSNRGELDRISRDKEITKEVREVIKEILRR